MDITDILLPLKPGRDEGAAIAIAASLGHRFGARVCGLCLTPLPSLQPEDCYAFGASAIQEVLEHADADVKVRRLEVERPFRSAMRESKCEHGWSATAPGELAVETALRARVTDLVVLTRPWSTDGTDLPFVECMIRLAGVPCLLTPSESDPPASFEHVVVAWNGSRQAKRALDDALPLLWAASRVTLLHAGHVDEAHGPHGDLVEYLAGKGINAKLALAPKGEHGPAHSLLDWCAQHQADLLVMGAFGHTPRAERWLGGTTWTVLTTARLPVLMSC